MQDETFADHSEAKLPEEEAQPEEGAQDEATTVDEAEPEADDEAAPLPESGVTGGEDEAAEEAAPAETPTANLESLGRAGEEKPAEETGLSAKEIEARASAWLHSTSSDGEAAEERQEEIVKAQAEPVAKASESEEEEEFEWDGEPLSNSWESSAWCSRCP